MSQFPLSEQAQVININQDWQFVKSKTDIDVTNLAADTWQQVSLPHTPKIEPIVVNDQFQGFSWYKKSINLPTQWQDKVILVRFEAAMNIADLWLNGEHIGQHVGGYLPFVVDLTEHLNFGQANHLLVKLDNNDSYITGPKPLEFLDFNTYGGLYRDANLLVKNKLHITDEILAAEEASGGIFVTYPMVSKDKARVEIKTHVQNSDLVNQDIKLVQLLKKDGKVVAQAQASYQLDKQSAKQVSQTLDVINPELWHPNHPNLYQLETQLYASNVLQETTETRIGIREFKFDDKHQLYINGEKFFLRGVNRHQEYPHLGYAISAEADYRDAYKIKSAGFDYVRLSHYPHSKAFMAAADELGLVLIDAILGWQYYSPFKEFREQILQTCRDLIRRDRNHASVIAWECSLNESWMPDYFLTSLNTAVHSEYPGSYSAGWQTGFDLYLQARQHRLEHYSKPTQPYNVSEYGDWEYYAQNAGLSQDSWADLKAEERTSRQLLSTGEKRLLQQARNIQEAHNDNLNTPAFADGYWVMFDYNRGYADDLEASGIMSIFRSPKYSYYFYQSQRSADIVSSDYQSGPMVFIASEWQAESSLNVRVFSNADEVELWLNGQLISRNKPLVNDLSSNLAHPPFEFELDKFEAGELIAKAYINKQLVAEHSVATPGQVSSIELEIDTSGKLPATGVNDAVFVYANLTDANGRVVPINEQKVHFETQGDVQLIAKDFALSEKGIASGLLKIGASLEGAKIRAHYKEKDISTPWLDISEL
ncbi:DNA primase [Catenovulum maritimum]|uniref:DNA primase n=1 Tax=Catenovulum maritimum TaxID=1513271 RepID=A0A0J8H1U0_9ALTE|nr:DNA primase [Catenovulum maritimum]